MLSPHECPQAEGSEPHREHRRGGADDPETAMVACRPAGGVRDPGECGREQKEESAERGPLLGRRHELDCTATTISGSNRGA